MQLQNLQENTKRGAVERALQLWTDRGALRDSGAEEGNPGRYFAVTGDGTVWTGLSLRDARLLVHGLASGSEASIDVIISDGDDVHGSWYSIRKHARDRVVSS